MPAWIARGVRTVLAVRYVYSDQNETHATTVANTWSYLNYMDELMAMRSFGQMKFNITFPTECLYRSATLTRAGATAAGAGTVMSDSRAVVAASK